MKFLSVTFFKDILHRVQVIQNSILKFSETFLRSTAEPVCFYFFDADDDDDDDDDDDNDSFKSCFFFCAIKIC